MTDPVHLHTAGRQPPRHPELVSGSISPNEHWAQSEGWMLKQVQHDETSFVRERGQTQTDRQIMPIGVLALNQIDLPLPVPTLELLLPRNCAVHVSEQLEADKPVDFVSGCKAAEFAVAVLPKARDQIAGDADIKRAIGLAGEDIDTGIAFELHGTERESIWMLKQVQHDVITKSSLH